MDFHVADGTILGTEACLNMERLCVNEGSICTICQDQQSSLPPRASTPKPLRLSQKPRWRRCILLTNEMILQQYADAFTGVGKLCGEVHSEIDPTAKTVQMPRRGLPE
jgi:hypothetical protein